MMKLIRGVVLFFLFSILFVNCVEALRVSPARYVENFEPGFEKTFRFTFTHEDKEAVLQTYVSGDLVEYVSLSNDLIDGEGYVDATVSIPGNIEVPGLHRIKVGAIPIDRETGGMVGVVVSVRGVIDLHVPYPGEYADLDFDVRDANEGEDPSYELVIYSRGSNEVNVNSEVKVFDSEDNSVYSLPLGNVVVDPGKFFEYDSLLRDANLKPGTYTAKAFSDYGSGSQEKSDVFRIGELKITIVNYTREVKKGGIRRFEMEVESLWNDPIPGVFAEVSVVGTDVTFTTPTSSIQRGFGKTYLEGYIDTTDFENENIEALVKLNYNGKVSEEKINIGVVDSGFEFKMLYLVIGIILLVVIAFVVWVVLKLKSLERKNAKK
jgi:hypothetical protein